MSQAESTRLEVAASTAASYEEFFRDRTGRLPFKYQCAVWQGIWEKKNIILRAPTGAGKTWAVLIPFLYAIHSNGEGRPNRLIYALPLRTLAQGVCRVARELVERMGLPVDGRMELGREVVPPFVTMQTGEQPDDRFFDRGRIIVTTYDQVLSGLLDGPYGLSSRLHNINAAAVAGSLVVFDEFHLMEPQKAFLTAVAGLHLFRDLCQSVWMTATATHPLECALKDALNAQRIPVDNKEEDELLNSLPAVTTVTRNLIAEDHPLTADDVLRQHSNRSIVLLNTVGRAQAMFEALRSRIGKRDPKPELILLHSRFFKNDRKAKEEKLKKLFGEDSRGNAILIATQVVEAGLDISCEHVHSELCPMNALIQRAGRCARFPHEKGTVHVYPLLPGERNWLPYGDQREEAENLKKTRTLLERDVRAKLDPRRAAAWVQEVHAEDDDRGLREGWSARLTECLRRIEQNAIVRNSVRVADLIRGDDTDSVRIIISEEATRPETPGQREAVTVRRGSVSRLLRAHPGEIGWVWDGFEDVGWKPLQNEEDLKATYVVCVRPAAAAYDSEIGLRLGVVGAEESPPRAEPPRPGYSPLRCEPWSKHARGVAHEAASRLESGGWNRGLLRIGLQRRYGLDPNAVAEAVRACALLHDLGKLQDGWQRWAEAAQKARDAEYQHTTALAHTDFDPENPKDRERERALGLRRPPHAAASAYYGAAFLAKLLPSVAAENLEHVASACAAAILSHHGGWLPEQIDLGVSELWADWEAPISETLGWVPQKTVLARLEAHRDKRGATEELLGVTSRLECLQAWWPLVAFLSRTLRLSDQRATAESGGLDG
ncbi:MAG: CRISPR-associated helicase Cas3' [Acidobacteria bacterium]|nr:CRISPR-associated helicase Cas3' [Acidobacteriota bacterium]